MNEAVSQTAPTSGASVKRVGWLVVIIVFGVLWFELINQLKPEWWLNPQYNYGLIVPLLALYLFWKRWRNRPTPAPPAATTLPIALILFCAALFLPIRFLAEANPDWRLLSWVLALVVVTISLSFLYLIGGRAWLRHLALPILFFLVAVPWPVRIEQVVIQDLMRIVTAINVTFLQLAAVPALQHGNVIEVGTGFIGIEEACSGVRSLQATLMVSLFLGELYYFTWPRRVLLIVLGALLAFVCNVVRTAILVWAGTTSGPKSIEAWHDPAGFTILMVCLFGLWVASLIMQRWRGNLSPVAHSVENQRAPVQLNWSLLGALAIWFLLAEAGVQIWYRSHQTLISSRWAVRWPESESNYKQLPIDPAAETLLRYNEGGGAAWEGSDGRQWMMYFFRWLPGRTAARFVKVHRPDICLPASGRTMERDNGLRMLAVNGVTLPVRSYRFDDRGIPLHVFYCYWDARSSYETTAAAESEDWSARGRLRSALQGRREIGAQMLEIVVWGYQDDGEAREALARELGQVIRRS
ncbi:MAG TPA: exosortase/archaeosortase family protein [Chthoniobacterales bacterium]|nr:exosortase/archaeosortase family protein [Chthoniobacterales bacterium]